MKKYLSKADVDHGLVDPKLPLEQQAQYKAALEAEHAEKQKKIAELELEQKTVRDAAREATKKAAQKEKLEIKQNEDGQDQPKDQKQSQPQKGNRGNYQQDKFKPKYEGKGQNESYPRKNTQRPKNKYPCISKNVTLELQTPAAPQKALPKPDVNKHQAILKSIKSTMEALSDKRRKLIDDKNEIIANIKDNRRTGKTFNAKLNVIRKEFDPKLTKLYHEIHDFKMQKELLLKQIQEITHKNPQSKEPQSVEALQKKCNDLERKLMTDDIGKKREDEINKQIATLKRQMRNAQSEVDVMAQSQRNNDQLKGLYKELDALKPLMKQRYEEVNTLKAELSKLEESVKEEVDVVPETRSIEEINKEYDQRIDKVKAQIDALKLKRDETYDAYNKAWDAYDEQCDLLDYIQFVKEEKQYILKRIKQDEARKKEKEQYEARKLKEKEDYEKRKEEKRKMEEEWKAKEEERKKKLQADREKFINRNPHEDSIDLCNFLIGYCQDLRPESKNTVVEKPKQEGITIDKDWAKEIKKGAQIMASKKSKVEEEIPKKVKKEKKKDERNDDDSFSHNFEIINRFQFLKVLPPSNLAEIDDTIKQIQAKIEIYRQPSAEDIEAFKARATKEFDIKHGFAQESKTSSYHQKSKETANNDASGQDRHQKAKKQSKPVFSEADFPDLK